MREHHFPFFAVMNIWPKAASYILHSGGVTNGKHLIDPRNDTAHSFACPIPVPSVGKLQQQQNASVAQRKHNLGEMYLTMFTVGPDVCSEFLPQFTSYTSIFSHY